MLLIGAIRYVEYAEGMPLWAGLIIYAALFAGLIYCGIKAWRDE